jgi:hypothetical protein
MAIRNEFTEGVIRDMYGYYLESYPTLPTVYSQVFEVKQMTGAFDKQTTAIGLGRLSERAEGDNIVASNIMEGYTVLIKARTFSDAFWVTMEFQEDMGREAIANAIRDFARTWTEGMIATKEQFAADFYNYGGFLLGKASIFNNSVSGQTDAGGDLIYDGKPWFALTGNNHPAKNGSTYYNSLGALALSTANLQTAYTLYTSTNNRNERGEKIALKPDTLIIPPGLHFTANTLLETDRLVGGANNDKNPVQNLVKPIEWQYLTNAYGWFLSKVKSGKVFYERKAPVIDFFQDDFSKKYYATIDTRFGAGITNWRYDIASNISTS